MSSISDSNPVRHLNHAAAVGASPEERPEELNQVEQAAAPHNLPGPDPAAGGIYRPKIGVWVERAVTDRKTGFATTSSRFFGGPFDSLLSRFAGKKGAISGLFSAVWALRTGDIGQAGKQFAKWGASRIPTILCTGAGIGMVGLGVAAFATGAGALPGVVLTGVGAAIVGLSIAKDLFPDPLVKGNFANFLYTTCHLSEPAAKAVTHGMHAALIAAGVVVSLGGGLGVGQVVGGAVAASSLAQGIGTAASAMKAVNLVGNVGGLGKAAIPKTVGLVHHGITALGTKIRDVANRNFGMKQSEVTTSEALSAYWSSMTGVFGDQPLNDDLQPL